MEIRDIELTTRTPIWTGGADQTMDRIHETSIIGSLRWWYEALVRGVGGRACDPSTGTCLYDLKKPNQGICDVCRLFGATGWRRRFRFQITSPLNPESKVGWPGANRQGTHPFAVPRPDGNGTTAVYLRPGHAGTIWIRVTGSPPELALLTDILHVATQWGGIGARNQVGFGVVAFAKPYETSGRLLARLTEISTLSTSNGSSPALPEFGRMFFARVPTLNAQGTQGIREMIRQKADLRSLFRPDPGNKLIEIEARHALFGFVKGDNRSGGKINISRPYENESNDWEIRVWGWVPASIRLSNPQPGGNTHISATDMITRIQAHLTTISAGASASLFWTHAPHPASQEKTLQWSGALIGGSHDL